MRNWIKMTALAAVAGSAVLVAAAPQADAQRYHRGYYGHVYRGGIYHRRHYWGPRVGYHRYYYGPRYRYWGPRYYGYGPGFYGYPYGYYGYRPGIYLGFGL